MTTANLEQTRFLRYSRTVGMTTMRGRGFYYPMDSAIAGDGRIYVVNRSSERAPADTVRVTVLNMEGEYFGVFGAQGDGDGEFFWPCGIAVDADGRVYVSDEHLHRITRFTASGDFASSWGTPGSGAPATIETADVALMADDLAMLPYAVRVARLARRLVRLNIAVALGLKMLLAIGAVGGVVSLMVAVLVGDMGASILVTLNAMRLAHVKPDGVR